MCARNRRWPRAAAVGAITKGRDSTTAARALAAVRARALPLEAVHIVYTYDADCDDDMRGACRASIEAHLDHELPGVPRRSFASLPGAAGVARLGG